MAIPAKWLAAALLLGGTAAWGWWAAGDAPAVSTSIKAPAGTFAPSLTGTQVDGGARMSDNGELVVDEALRQLFDYYLATTGERDLNAVRAMIAAELKQRLSRPALEAALGLFDRYIAFKQAIAAATTQPSGQFSSMADRLSAARKLRQRFFTASESAGLFGQEDSYDDFTLKRLQIMANKTLSAEEKSQRIRELENQLPDSLRKSRQAPMQEIRLNEAEALLHKNGGSEQDLYSLRAQMVGQAAADRLATLDQEQAQWKGRIDSFKQARQQIQQDASLDAQQRQAALDKLAADSFSPQEQRRLPAYGIK